MPHKLGHTAGKGIVPKLSLMCKNVLTHTTNFEDTPLPSVVPLLNHWSIHTHIMHNSITKPHIKTHTKQRVKHKTKSNAQAMIMDI